MFRFYDIDTNYIKFLKKIDKQVPDIKYTTTNKFVCGVVLDINGFNIMLLFHIRRKNSKQVCKTLIMIISEKSTEYNKKLYKTFKLELELRHLCWVSFILE